MKGLEKMYAYNRSNVAYDLSQFDTDERAERKIKERAKNEITVHKTSVAKTGNWFKTVVFVAFAALLAFAIVGSKAVISEISTEISEQTNQLEEARRENVRLQAKLDNMVTLSRVEDVAVNELGLQKTAKNQVHYISIYDRTMVQVADTEPNVFETLMGWINGTAEYLGF